MKNLIICLFLGFLWTTDALASPIYLFGEDIGSGVAVAANRPNTEAAHAAFVSYLTGSTLENFDGFSTTGFTPAQNLSIFGGAATLDQPNWAATGNGGVQQASHIQSLGNDNIFAISGPNILQSATNNTNLLFRIDFNNPIAAFGGYGIGVGQNGGQFQAQFMDGSTIIWNVPHSTNIPYSGGGANRVVNFFGFITPDNPITRIDFYNTANLDDRFFFDNMEYATVPQVVPLPPSVVLVFSGLVGMALLGRRKAKFNA